MELESLEYELQTTWKLKNISNTVIGSESHNAHVQNGQCRQVGNRHKIFDPQCIVHKHLFTHISNMRH